MLTLLSKHTADWGAWSVFMLCITHACHFWQGIHYFSVARYLRSVLVLSPLFLALSCASFHLFLKIYIEWLISIMYFLLPDIKFNFLRLGSKTELRRLIEMSLCPTGVKPGKSLFLLQPFHFQAVSFFANTWVEFLLGNIETIGQMGVLPDRCRSAIQVIYLDFKMGSPGIHKFFFLNLF